MIIIKKRDKDSIDRMLKRYKRKCKQTKLIRQIREERHFTKPSDKKRLIKQKAVYREWVRNQQNKD